MDIILNQSFTSEQLAFLLAHAVRDIDFMRDAAPQVKIKQFEESEAPYTLIWAIGQQYYETYGKLPTRDHIVLECQARASTDPVFKTPEYQRMISEAVKKVYSVALDGPCAADLLGKFCASRNLGYLLNECVATGCITDEAFELIAQARKSADGHGRLNVADCSLHTLFNSPELLQPATFLSTGYPELDTVLGGGFATGEMTTLAAATSVGKSTFATNMAVKMAAAGVPVLFVSLEMKAIDLARLALSILTGVKRVSVRTGTFSELDLPLIKNGISQAEGNPLYIIDRNRFSSNMTKTMGPDMAAVEAIIRNSVKAQGIKIVFLDYTAKIGPHNEEDVTRLAKLNAWAFFLAQELNIHLVSIAQFNKASFSPTKKNDKQVGLEHVRGVIDSVSNADNVIALVREDWNSDEPQDPVALRAVVLKARQGPTGTVSLYFHKSIGLIDESPPYQSDNAESTSEATATAENEAGSEDNFVKEAMKVVTPKLKPRAADPGGHEASNVKVQSGPFRVYT